VNPKSQHGQLSRILWGDLGKKFIRVFAKESRGRSDGFVMFSADLAIETETPSPDLAGDQGLTLLGDDPGCGKDSAVESATGPGPILVDRAFFADQHRAATPLVVSEQKMAARLSRRWKQQLLGDVGKSVDLVGPDMDELRRCTASDTTIARHVGIVFAANRGF